jgi:hypothetical protein
MLDIHPLTISIQLSFKSTIGFVRPNIGPQIQLCCEFENEMGRGWICIISHLSLA